MSSNKDDLILDIVEKIHDKVETVQSDIQDMKIEQVRQNIIVTQHEQRSTNLEQIVELVKKESDNRLSSLEKDAQFFKNAIIILTSLGGLAGFLIKTLHLFH